jgi:hypothetical protein
MDRVSFLDDRTFAVGDRVQFDTKYGSTGTGTVTGFGRDFGSVTVKIAPDDGTEYGRMDRWPLKTGGFFCRISDHGIHGGEIVGHVNVNPAHG